MSSPVFRVAAQANILVEELGEVKWKPAFEGVALVVITPPDIDGGHYRLSSHAEGKMIIDMPVTIDMALERISECFVAWRDQIGGAWGLNFVSSLHADKMMEVVDAILDPKKKPVTFIQATIASQPKYNLFYLPTGFYDSIKPESDVSVDSETDLLMEQFSEVLSAYAESAIGNESSDLPPRRTSDFKVPKDMLLKRGMIDVKMFSLIGKKLKLSVEGKHSKDFKKYWAMLGGSDLSLYDKNDKMITSLETCQPLHTFSVVSCLAMVEKKSKKDECAFSISLSDGTVLSMRAETQRECEDWVICFHKCAGFHQAQSIREVDVTTRLQDDISSAEQALEAERERLRKEGDKHQKIFVLGEKSDRASGVALRVGDIERSIELRAMELYRLRCYRGAFLNVSQMDYRELQECETMVTRHAFEKFGEHSPVLVYAAMKSPTWGKAFLPEDAAVHDGVAEDTGDALQSGGAQSSGHSTGLLGGSSGGNAGSDAVLVANDSADSKGKGGLFDKFKDKFGSTRNTLTKSSIAAYKEELAREEASNTVGSSVNNSSANPDTRKAGSGGGGGGSGVRLRLPNGEEIMTSFTNETTVGDLLVRAASHLSVPPVSLMAISQEARAQNRIIDVPEVTLASALPDHVLLVQRKYVRSVILEKDSKGSFGFFIRLGTIPLAQHSKTILVSRVQKESVNITLMFAGDEVMAVNSVSTEGMNFSVVADILKDAKRLLLVKLRSRVALDNSNAGVRQRQEKLYQTYVQIYKDCSPTPPADLATVDFNLSPNPSGGFQQASSATTHQPVTFSPTGPVSICPAPPVSIEVYSDEFLQQITVPIPPGPIGESRHRRATADKRLRFEDVDILFKSLAHAVEEVTLLFHVAKATAKRGAFGLSKRQLAKNTLNEIVTSEKSYVKSLNQLVDTYLRPLKSEPWMDQQDFKFLSSNLFELQSFQNEFVADLDRCVREEITEQKDDDVDADAPHSVAQCFIRHKRGFELYGDFVPSHPDMLQVLTEVMPDPKMREFVISRNPKKQPTMGLESFLSQSVHRLMQYPFFVKELLNYSEDGSVEHKELNAAMQVMIHVSDLVTEKQRVKQAVDTGLDILFTVEAWEGPTVDQLGGLTYYGELNRMEGKTKREVECFLFPGAFVLCKVKQRGKKVKFVNMLRTNVLVLRNREDVEGCQFSFELLDINDINESKKKNKEPQSVILCAKNEKEKLCWVNYIISHIETAVGAGMAVNRVPQLSVASVSPASVSSGSHSLPLKSESSYVDPLLGKFETDRNKATRASSVAARPDPVSGFDHDFSSKNSKQNKKDNMRTWSGAPKNVKAALKDMKWTDDTSQA